eukprot:4140407-Prymnesium_polylepis.1
MHSGRWAEAAHLFRPNLAPDLKMFLSGRRRAGRFDLAPWKALHGSRVCSASGHRGGRSEFFYAQ